MILHANINIILKNLMSNEIRALDLISMLINNKQNTSNPIKISFTDVNKFRNNLLSEGISFDLGLYDFEDISYEFPQNIKITSKEIIVRIDDDLENRVLRNISYEAVLLKSWSYEEENKKDIG